MGETLANRDILLELSSGTTRLFRNNVGVLQDRNGSYVRYGLCVGSSDIVGFHSVLITPEMVGRTVAVFTGIETKTAAGLKRKSKHIETQSNFLQMIRDHGGIAGFATTVEEARHLLNEYTHKSMFPR